MAKQILDNWFFTPSGTRMVGNIINDVRKRFPDGTQVITSTIKKYKKGIVYTFSGSEYKLGNPNVVLFNITED